MTQAIKHHLLLLKQLGNEDHVSHLMRLDSEA
jgi:hypothetical protein